MPETDTSTEGAHVGDPGDIAQARTFGVVGAYDGHRAGIGRVAVNSTWHHFFDINLIGDPIAPFPKTQGYNASPAGVQSLEDIRAYYRNLSTWLARPGALARVFAGAVWYALRTQPDIAHPGQWAVNELPDYSKGAQGSLRHIAGRFEGRFARCRMLSWIKELSGICRLLPNGI